MFMWLIRCDSECRILSPVGNKSVQRNFSLYVAQQFVCVLSLPNIFHFQTCHYAPAFIIDQVSGKHFLSKHEISLNHSNKNLSCLRSFYLLYCSLGRLLSQLGNFLFYSKPKRKNKSTKYYKYIFSNSYVSHGFFLFVFFPSFSFLYFKNQSGNLRKNIKATCLPNINILWMNERMPILF